MADSITIASLCSGVGMLDEGVRLGCAHLGIGTRVACYCEWEAYSSSVLLARMEDASLEPAPVWCGDLADFDGQEFAGKVDIVTAGFPCQPWSCAGQQRGAADERWIWDAIGRFIRTVRPAIVFLENVPGLVSGGGLNAVLADLADAGFDAEWCALSAADCGASHRRERVFILAYARREHGDIFQRLRGVRQHSRSGDTLGDASRERRRSRHHAVQSSGSQPSAGQADDVGEGRGRMANAVRTNAQLAAASRRDGAGAAAAGAGQSMANASGAGRKERSSVGRNDGAECEAIERSSEPVADTISERCGQEQRRAGDFGEASGRHGRRHASSAAESGGVVVNAPSIGTDAGELAGCEYVAFAPGPTADWGNIPEALWPAVESGFHVLVDGNALVVDASRTDQLRCAGNGVVALCAAAAFVELMRRAGVARAVREAVEPKERE